MPVYEISCPHCSEMFELQIGLDVDETVLHIRKMIEASDEHRRFHAFRTYSEILSLCGERSKSLGANVFNECVRSSVDRGYLERRKIGNSWKFRWKKRHEYPASDSRRRKRRTGTKW